jgi:hypothetical protein
MNSINPILLISFIVVWVIGTLLYFNRKKENKNSFVIQSDNYNSFVDEESNVKELTVNIIYDDYKELDKNVFCDMVIKAKDLFNHKMISTEEKKLNEKTHETLHEENIKNINFNELININQIQIKK